MSSTPVRNRNDWPSPCCAGVWPDSAAPAATTTATAASAAAGSGVLMASLSRDRLGAALVDVGDHATIFVAKGDPVPLDVPRDRNRDHEGRLLARSDHREVERRLRGR